MNSSAEKILYRKAALIFEELGFLMPRSDNVETDQADRVSAIITFTGPFSGCLLVSLSSGMLPQLSTNMLGAAEQSNEDLERDSLGEIANVICGNALPAIYGFEPVFHLEAPELLDDPESMIDKFNYKKEAEVHISFDSGNASVTLLVDQTAST
ncbi:MAG: chemotaxis protein CheX [Acidobacteria bacterium]|nr:chemotaxis protein CheX [Acidobacteriota bacterium]